MLNHSILNILLLISQLIESMSFNKRIKGKNSLLSKWKNRNKSIQDKEQDYLLPKGMRPLLANGQERLWFLQQLHNDNPFYHYADTYHITGDLDVDILIKSFNILVERHEILRTTFKINEGQVFQNIRKNFNVDIRLIDLKKLERGVKEEKAIQIAIEQSRHPFNLEEDSLIRVFIIQLDNKEYLVVLNMHHIIGDKSSLVILQNELAHIYIALVENKAISLETPKLQYKDFAYWERKQKINETSLKYWKEKLSGHLTFLNLPTDYQRLSILSYNGKCLETSLSGELSSSLKRIAKENNTTLFVFMLAAFKVLLHKYSGQEDILIGTPINSKSKMIFEPLIGFFNDTVVLRSTVSNFNSFLDFANQVRDTTLEAFSNKDISFTKVVQELKLERHSNINPIFQTMFLCNKVEQLASFGDNLEIDYKILDIGVSKFDLTLFVNEFDQYISTKFEYSTDLFEHATIERMHEHYRTLLENIVQKPSQPISDLSILPKTEQNLLLNEWNKTQVDLPTIPNIHTLIEENAQKTPHEVAVVFENKTLTYQELNEKATNVAKYLIRQGVKRNDLVGLYTERSVEMIIGILAILKAGGGYIPLDPEYPIERIEYMIADAKMPVILSQAHLVDNFYDIKVIAIEHVKPITAQIALPKVSETDTAYVIYTSGSTGKPKGVVVSHGNLIHSTTTRYHFYEKQPSAFLLLSSFAFDSSIVGLFWTLCHGGKLVLPKHRIEQDLDTMGNLIDKHQVSHTLLLPSLYNVILEHIAIDKLKSLNTVIVAGEACSSVLTQKHYSLLSKKVALYNEYGPTEASVWCIAHRVDVQDTQIPIGKPIPNTTAYILDKKLRPVPVGVIGDLYIGGNGITQGYLNRPELTAERFIQNPFSENSDDKLYKTGDLAKYRADGIIDFLGRADYQIKIRGYRIELEEIREVVKQYEEVQEAIVVVHHEKTRNNDEELNEVDELIEKLLHLDESEQERILQSLEELDNDKLELLLKNTEIM